MPTRNVKLGIADLVGSTRHARHMWNTTKTAGPRRRLGGHNRGTQEEGSDRAGGPTRLSKVVAMSVVRGVEQVCAGGWKGDVGERAGHILHRKQAVTTSISNQR
jgi:hypothetical protein